VLLTGSRAVAICTLTGRDCGRHPAVQRVVQATARPDAATPMAIDKASRPREGPR